MANGNGLPKPHYVKFEREWRDSAKKTLSNAQWWKVAGAVVDYFLDEEEPELPEKAKLVFETLRPQLDYRRRKSVEQLRWLPRIRRFCQKAKTILKRPCCKT